MKPTYITSFINVPSWKVYPLSSFIDDSLIIEIEEDDDYITVPVFGINEKEN